MEQEPLTRSNSAARRRAALLPTVLAGVALASLAACAGNSTEAPPMAPYTYTPSPTGTSTPTASPTDTSSPTGATSPGGATVSAADLAGTTYTSTNVTGRTLVTGTQIEARFGQNTLAVKAGCNRMFGAYELDGGTLHWRHAPVTTTTSCSPERTAQDQWVKSAFRRGLQVAGDASALTLSNATVTIRLAPNGG